jgi:hypothetical protein
MKFRRIDTFCREINAMKLRLLLWGSVLLAALLTPQSGFACGEGMYAMGEGARHRGYLAPRKATVLIYNDQGTVPEATKAVYRGLVHAGHKVEVARNAGQLSTALRDRRYDVVIAEYDQIDVIDLQVNLVSKTSLLPIVPDKQRSSDGWKQRFRFSLTQGASLGQYLKLIDKVVKDRA